MPTGIRYPGDRVARAAREVRGGLRSIPARMVGPVSDRNRITQRGSRMVQLSMRNDLEDLGRIGEEVETELLQRGVGQACRADARIVLDEILSNIVKYGYDDQATHEITVGFVIENGRIRFEIVDEGVPFDPTSAEPVVPATDDVDERRIGGLGISFVRHLVDDIEYERLGNRNRLRLTMQGTDSSLPG